MKALTIKQPWLWCITDHTKRVENRTWKPPFEMVGQYIALHASKSKDQDEWLEAWYIADGCVPKFANLPLGAIVATALVKGYVVINDMGGVEEQTKAAANYYLSTDPWFFGPVGWLLSDVRKLPQPIPCKGALGLWEVPADIVEIIKQEWEEAR